MWALTAEHIPVLVALPSLCFLFILNSSDMLGRSTAHSLIRSASAGLDCKSSLQTRAHRLLSLQAHGEIHLEAVLLTVCTPARRESWIRKGDCTPGIARSPGVAGWLAGLTHYTAQSLPSTLRAEEEKHRRGSPS